MTDVPLRWPAALVAVLALTSGCTATGPDPEPGPAASVADTFTNPVHSDNFPDPGVIRHEDTWYAYGTTNAAANVPVRTSPDLVTWTGAGDAMPEIGSWAAKGNTWAPEVIAGGGGWLLYYTARSTATDRQCIGVAFSAKPEGPFVDESDKPLICQADEGG